MDLAVALTLLEPTALPKVSAIDCVTAFAVDVPVADPFVVTMLLWLAGSSAKGTKPTGESAIPIVRPR